MIKSGFKIHIPNPHKKDISKYLLTEILRQANISLDLLNKDYRSEILEISRETK